MPCEACNIQFTVFKRKKSCTECRRLYCSNCLTKNKERILCKRCVIFTTRPLSKIELLKLKAKDLIFYLQSKHISTTGCVEKEELVNLVLIHVGNTNNFSPDSQQSQTSFSMGSAAAADDDARANPFDQIRSTCQNLFSTFTEKIAADFNFDLKPNQSDRQRSQPNVCEDQPRYSHTSFNYSYNSNSGRNNGSSTTTTASSNGNKKSQRPTTMTTSSVNQSTTYAESPSANAFNRSGTTANNTHSSPTITGNSSSGASSPPMSSDDDGTRTKQNGLQSPTAPPLSPMAPPLTPTAPSLRPTASTSAARTKPTCAKNTSLSKVQCCNDGSGCECSDDELIAKFRESYGTGDLSPLSPIATTEKSTTPTVLSPGGSNMSKSKSSVDNCLTLDSSTTTTRSSTTKTIGGNSSTDVAMKEEASALEESSDVSSFEDLGAVGGIMNNNIIPSTSDTEKWQILNGTTWSNIDDTASVSSIVVATVDQRNESSTTNGESCGGIGISYTTNLPNSISELPQINNESENQRQQQHLDETMNETETFQSQQHSTMSEQQPQHQQQQQQTTELRSKLEKTLKSRQAHRKITRRQSDGIVYTASTSNSNHRMDRRYLDDVDDDDEECSSTSEEVSTHKRAHRSSSCRKCGKTKCGDLRKYIAKFRHQLETTTTFSEIEIKQQLDAFLAFLETHSSGAFDSKDDESIPNTVQSPSQFMAEVIELEAEFDDDEDDDDYDDEAGIHVYGSNDDTNASAHPPRQFFDLNSVEKKAELDELSVKQLKEVLMLNRVDFKGCCEKSELLERVQRLWDDLQNCPAVDKLPTVDLCKICMDAAIECVLLECGHMATCTNCGKVLSECPICRQYIVRVVRFFKA